MQIRRWAPIALALLVGCSEATNEVDSGPATDSGSIIDAGANDSGTTDSGISDAGLPDSGPVDSGAPDSGPIDAGTPIDAGPPQIPQDGGAIIIIDVGDGGEFRTGNGYVMHLNQSQGALNIAAYQASLDATNPTDIVDGLSLRQSVLNPDGTARINSSGERTILYLSFGHFPTVAGTFTCGQPVAAGVPGKGLTMSLTASARNDAMSTDITVDDYLGYPIPYPPVGCTVVIDRLDASWMSGSFTAKMFTYASSDIVQVHGSFSLPTPRCTSAQSRATPQTCVPWLF